MSFKFKYQPNGKSYEMYLQELISQNNKKLKALGRFSAPTDGEHFIAYTLQNLGYGYIEQFVMEGLNGDKKKFRIADFFLPREMIVIEHCGRWDTSEEDKKRYRHKRFVYERNGIKYIFIYPKQLNNITWILQKEIEKKLHIIVQPELPVHQSFSQILKKLFS